ncbi:hypothetical protein LEP3755_50590 [Leptolyngbya sp. NIES-3755]|nr:hypothetical protein LEP3755_50590 [Leptolyngbya sp. NIES-3755]
MDLEQAVLENLRLLPSEKQQHVLTFIQSLLSPDQETLLKQRIVDELLPILQQIQNFHDGLPSAVYADKLLRTTEAIAVQYPSEPVGQFIQSFYKLLATDNRWCRFTAEFYQRIYDLLVSLTNSKISLQQAIKTLGETSADTDMIQSGNVTDLDLDDE